LTLKHRQITSFHFHTPLIVYEQTALSAAN
jgi:hypothetical protein